MSKCSIVMFPVVPEDVASLRMARNSKGGTRGGIGEAWMEKQESSNQA